MSIKALTPREKKRAMETLTFLVEKRDGRTKSRTCANGSVQRGWMNREESSSPTAALESVMITGVINAHGHQDAATADVPNAFMQMHVKHEPGDEWMTMKIQGVLVDMLVELDLGLCKE